MFGADDIEANTDKRGVISADFAAQIRATRAAEQWERIDTICIGPGQAAIDRGWFNNWADFANADRIVWFSGRATNVGRSYTNQSTERTDWAQDLYQTLIEFIPPPGVSEIETDQNDALLMPTLFMQELMSQMPFTVTLADSDEIANAPGPHFPCGFGVSGTLADAAPSPVVLGGSNGDAHVSNGWKWPEPIMLAAKSKITVSAVIDNPMKSLLRSMSGPGSKLVPNGAGGTITYPNVYRIRVTHRGPRYLQLRGARSSA